MNHPENIFFINYTGKRIDCNSSYKEIIKEILWLGIDTSEITIDDLLKELDLKLRIKQNQIVKDETYLEQIREYNEFHNQIRVLYKHIIADAFNLYSYDEGKMPKHIKKIYNSKYIADSIK